LFYYHLKTSFSLIIESNSLTKNYYSIGLNIIRLDFLTILQKINILETFTSLEYYIVLDLVLFIFKFNLDKLNVIEIWTIYQVGIIIHLLVLILKFNFWNSVPTYNILLPP